MDELPGRDGPCQAYPPLRSEPAGSVPQQRGFTIPELMIAVATAGVLAAAAAKGLEYAAASNNAANLGAQGAAVYDELQNYVATNIDALINGAAVAGVAAPLAPTEAEMRALGYTTFSTVSTAGPGTTWNYSLALAPPACLPQNCNVLVYVGLSGAPRARDNSVDMHLVAMAAQNSGGRPAGFSSLESPSVISGLGGSWTLPNPLGRSPGILSFYGSYGGGQFGNYVRLGDSRPVTLNNSLTVRGAQTVTGALAVGANTNLGSALTVSRNADVGGALSVGGNSVTGGSHTVGGPLQVAGPVNIAGKSFIDAAGNTSNGGSAFHGGPLTVAGQINALNGQLYVAPSAWEGWACPANGYVTTNPAGRVLSCRNGVWERAGASVGGAGYVYVGDGGTCPPGQVVVGVGGFYATYTAGYVYCAPLN